MSVSVVGGVDRSSGASSAPQTLAPVRFPARVTQSSWPATRRGRDEVVGQLSSPPFVVDELKQNSRALGVNLLLGWLGDHPGRTWQERWFSSGADAARAGWRQVPTGWLRSRGDHLVSHQLALVEAMPVAICADMVRPSLAWLVGGGPARGGLLVRNMAASRDPAGFDRLRAHCDSVVGVSAMATSRTLYRSALIVAAKGGSLAEVTVGDVVELFDVEAEMGASSEGRALLYQAFHTMGIFESTAPPTLRALRTAGQRTPEELIDRYHLACRPVRDLLVDYLRERQPALDYNSLESLANFLGKLFWADIEHHHPGIASLRLPADVANGWKRRLQTLSKTTTTATGEKVELTVARINYRECLTPVRAFYLDLAHWAVDDPSRWGVWVAPCPVGEEEINRKKAKRRLKSRMDARTRERLPVLPVVVRSVDQRRKAAHASSRRPAKHRRENRSPSRDRHSSAP